MIGTTELLLIGGIALLVFGGKKVPEMMRGLGEGVKEFKKGMKDGEEKLTPENAPTPPTPNPEQQHCAPSPEEPNKQSDAE